MKYFRKYKEEDIYKLVAVVMHHPNEDHLSISFWHNMIAKYGEGFFCGRSPSGLKAKWLKIIAECENELMPHKKEIEQKLKPEKIAKIIGIIEGSIKDYSEDKYEESITEHFVHSEEKKEVNNENEKFIKYLVNRIAKKDNEINLTKNTENQDSLSKTEVTEILCCFDIEKMFNNSAKHCLENLVALLDDKFDINELKEDCECVKFTHNSDSKSFSVNDERTDSLEQYLDLDIKFDYFKEKYKMEFSKLYDLLKSVNGDFNELERCLDGEKVIQWTDFEDNILKINNGELYQSLIEKKGQEEVEKRKNFLELV